MKITTYSLTCALHEVLSITITPRLAKPRERMLSYYPMIMFKVMVISFASIIRMWRARHSNMLSVYFHYNGYLHHAV